MILNVNIAKRVATYTPSDEKPVCGNSGDQVKFTFDEEWDGHAAKTARFIWNGQYHDVEFTGDTCEMPIITMASAFSVGVYVGEEAEGEDVLSSTKAVIAITPSIRCETKRAGAGTGANYTNEAKGAAVRSEAAAVRSEAAAEAAEAAAELAGEAGGGGKLYRHHIILNAEGTVDDFLDFNDAQKEEYSDAEFTLKISFVVYDRKQSLSLTTDIRELLAQYVTRNTIDYLYIYYGDMDEDITKIHQAYYVNSVSNSHMFITFTNAAGEIKAHKLRFSGASSEVSGSVGSEV